MAQLSKIGILAGAIGTVSGGAAFISYWSVPKNIKDKLIYEGFNLNVTDWTAIFETYNLEDNKDLFELSDGETKTKETLIKKCREALSKNDTTNYKLAKRWCVKEEEISAIATRLNFKLLKTDTAESDNTHWKYKVSKVKNDTKIATELGVLSQANENINITNIKSGCAGLLKVKTTDKEFDEKFELAKNWCSQ